MIAFSKQAKNLETTQKTEDQASESSSTTHTPPKTTDGETNTVTPQMTIPTTTNLTQTETVTTNLLESPKEKFIFVEIYKVDSEDVLSGLDSLE